MANTNAPNGFQYFGRAEGGSPTAGLTYAPIAADYNVAIGFGDATIPVTGGGIEVATASTVPIFGIFAGCEYYSSAVGRKVWSPNWPGQASGAIGTGYTYADPQAWFQGQAATTAIAIDAVNTNAQLVAGTVSAFGFSTMAVNSTTNTTSTFPFRVVGLLSQFLPAGSVNGTDDANDYNRVILQGNFWSRTSTTGI